eukprot:3302299-Rhodomonas_salina.1
MLTQRGGGGGVGCRGEAPSTAMPQTQDRHASCAPSASVGKVGGLGVPGYDLVLEDPRREQQARGQHLVGPYAQLSTD